MDNRKEFLQGLSLVIKETTVFDFPFLASDVRKTEIIEEKKVYIEEQVKQLAPELWLPEADLIRVWNEALAHADKCYKSMPSKLKINGFYLQELMHFYSDRLGQMILSQIKEV